MFNNTFLFHSKILTLGCLPWKNIKICQRKVLSLLNSLALMDVCFSPSLTIMVMTSATTQSLLSTNWTIQLESLLSIRPSTGLVYMTSNILQSPTNIILLLLIAIMEGHMFWILLFISGMDNSLSSRKILPQLEQPLSTSFKHFLTCFSPSRIR